MFDTKGTLIRTWGRTGSEPATSRPRPAWRSTGTARFTVAEIGNDRVQVFDRDGKFLTAWGRKGSGNGEFGNLHGIFVDKETGWVYVCLAACRT